MAINITKTPTQVQTSDGTQTTGATYATSSGSLYQMDVKVSAISAGGVTGVWDLKFGFKNIGESLTILGSPTIVSSLNRLDSSAAAASWRVTADTSGTDVRIRITGQAATTIDWFIIHEVTEFTP